MFSENDINSWERINDYANIGSIFLGVLTAIFAFIVYYSGGKLQSLKDNRLSKIQADSNTKIAQANSVSETAKTDAAIAFESAAKANQRTEELQNENKQLDIEQSRITQENIKLRIDLEKEVLKRSKIQEHLTPRSLGEQTSFARSLTAFAGMSVDVKYVDDAEAKLIAGQLMLVFDMAGWNIKSVTSIDRETAGYTYVFKGIIIGSIRTGIPNPQDHSHQAGETLHSELERRGLLSRTSFASDLRGSDEYPLNRIEVIIALKPKVEFQEE